MCDFIHNCVQKCSSRIWKINVQRLLNFLFVFQETISGVLGFGVLPVWHPKFHVSKMNM